MRRCWTLIVTGLLLILLGCNGPEKNGGESGYRFKVGYINQAGYDENCFLCMQTFIDHVTSREFQKSVGSGRPVQVLTGDSDGNVEKQLNAVQVLIAADVDVMFIFGVETWGNAAAVEECNRAGIPVFMVASTAKGDFKMIGFDEYEFGLRQAEYAIQTLEPGSSICYMRGVPGRYPTILREQGVMDTLARRSDLKVLDNQAANFNKEDALQLSENWIRTYGDQIDCIICQDNIMASAVIEALKAESLLDKVSVIGNIAVGTWDAELIQNHQMEYAVYIDFSRLGELCAEVCRQFYRREPIPDYTCMELYEVTADSFDLYF